MIYVTLVWSTREAEIFLMFVGQMGCEALNFLLKRLIKEERPKRMPPDAPALLFLPHPSLDILFFKIQHQMSLQSEFNWLINDAEMNGKGYGMPSSHAQFVTFFSLSLSLFLLIRHTPRPSPTHAPFTFVQRILFSLLTILCAAAVAASRIYLNYHTVKQVLVGCGAGAFSAGGWFVFTMLVRRSGLLEWGLDLRVARMLRMRDLILGEDLAEAGWQKWEDRRRRTRSGELNGRVGKKEQ